MFCLRYTDKIFSISKLGKSYLKSRYPKFQHKIFCAYLGTQDHGTNPISLDTSTIHIVSCSSIISVKRLHLVVEILKSIKTQVIWTHIGDGELRESLLLSARQLPENIHFNFKGEWSPSELFSFYKNESIDVFINCSSSEGIPVSIMEAISFGIPVIATEVGGTSEIVNEITGKLIPLNFDPTVAASNIIDIKKNCSPQVRIKIKQFWSEHFREEINYSELLKHF